MRCHSGAEALQLLLRSDRIYLDITAHELFTNGGSNAGAEKTFDLSVHVAPFFEVPAP